MPGVVRQYVWEQAHSRLSPPGIPVLHRENAHRLLDRILVVVGSTGFRLPSGSLA
jgi:hypothetical protein